MFSRKKNILATKEDRYLWGKFTLNCPGDKTTAFGVDFRKFLGLKSDLKRTPIT